MKIDGYEFGSITVSGKAYTSDIIIYPDRVEPSWWRKNGHELSLDDIAGILALKPQILVIGTGASGRMAVPASVRKAIEDKGIKVIIRKTADACSEYNRTATSGLVIAALHLTC